MRPSVRKAGTGDGTAHCPFQPYSAFFRPPSVPLATLYCDLSLLSLFFNKTLSQQDCGQLQGKDPCTIGDYDCLEGGHNFVKKAKSAVTGWSVGLCLLSQKCG